MTGYLVIGRTADVDVPMGFFATLAGAEHFAGDCTVEKVREAVRKIYKDDVSGAQCVWIVPITNGVPAQGDPAVYFEED